MILRINNRGSRVRELQELLQKHGFWTHPTITDFFGPVTEKAVKDFQKEHNLSVDGIVGPKTWRLLALEPIKITPIYTDEDLNEDLSDPEEEMVISNVLETQPSCPKLSKLINLINTSIIDRNVIRLVYHCTATQPNATVEGILNYWHNTLKWKNPGYHIIVKPDGTWVQLQDFNRVSNGVAGINSTSIHIAYIGGIDRNGRAINNMTPEQEEVFITVYNTFKNKLPNLTFHGHNEFSNKACPSFNIQEWIKKIEKENQL